MKKQIRKTARLVLSLLVFVLIASTTSCADQYAYDDKNPEAYKKHWKNNKEIKDNEFLYQRVPDNIKVKSFIKQSKSMYLL